LHYRIDMAAVTALSGTADSHDAVLLAQRYLEDPTMYEPYLKRRSAREVTTARLLPHHSAALLAAGIVEPVAASSVRGRADVFPVYEWFKHRLRVIQNTKDVNSCLPPAPAVAFRSLSDRAALVHNGSHALQLDFAAYYTQFTLGAEIRNFFCHRLPMPEGRTSLVRLCVGPTGQSHMVYTAVATTRHLLAFPHKSPAHDDYIDNVLFVGDDSSLRSDLRVFVARCATCGVTINEDVSDPSALIATTLDWTGQRLDFTAKTVCLTAKIVDKIQLSWSLRDGWTWRGFAAHVGLLFYSMQVLDIPVAEFFGLLRFISEASKAMQLANDTAWDLPANIWPSAWPCLEAWTATATLNTPRSVPVSRPADVYVLVDSSAHGWGYIALDLLSGDTFHHGEAWNPHFVSRFGADRLRRSTFTEPWGILHTKRHLTPLLRGDRSWRLGSDSVTAIATLRRGYSGRSNDLNFVARTDRTEFPHLSCTYVHVAGSANIFADALSRGNNIARESTGLDHAESLRRLLGVTPVELSNRTFHTGAG
jgi:hypothetical protein